MPPQCDCTLLDILGASSPHHHMQMGGLSRLTHTPALVLTLCRDYYNPSLGSAASFFFYFTITLFYIHGIFLLINIMAKVRCRVAVLRGRWTA